MLAPEDENEAEVRREDQENINRFARLNARLHEVKAERESLQVGWIVVSAFRHQFYVIFNDTHVVFCSLVSCHHYRKNWRELTMLLLKL